MNLLQAISSLPFFRSLHHVLAHNSVNQRRNDRMVSLSDNATAALVSTGNKYKAVSAAELTIKGSANTALLNELLESQPIDFDYIVSVRQIDAKRFVEGLEMKKRLKEIQIGKVDKRNYARVNMLKKELELINGEISKVVASKPVALRVLLRAYAVSESPYTAAKAAVANLESIANAFSNSLGANYDVLKGDALLQALGYLEGL